MKETQILLWKTIEGNSNRRLRVRVTVRSLLFYSELAPTDPWCDMLRDFTGMEKIWGGNARWTDTFAKCEFCCCCGYNDDWSCKTASKASACLMMSSNVLRWLVLARISVCSDLLLIPLISWSLRWMSWRLHLASYLGTLWACKFTVRGWWLETDNKVFYGFIFWLGNGAKFEAVDSWIWLLCNNIF